MGTPIDRVAWIGYKTRFQFPFKKRKKKPQIELKRFPVTWNILGLKAAHDLSRQSKTDDSEQPGLVLY